MKKIIKSIQNWWNYTILKKHHVETKIIYGSAINKYNRTYYYKDTAEITYKGNMEIGRTRLSRVFVSYSEYYSNTKK